MKKTLLALVLALSMLLALPACSPADPGSSPDSGNASGVKYVGDTKVVYNPELQEDGVNRIGIAYSTLKYSASQLLVQNYEDHYQEYGFDECVVLTAEGDLETQIGQIQDLVNQKCDLIVVNSIDAGGVAAVCDAAMKAGVAIIAVDRKIGTDIYYGIETDNTSAGRDLAMTAADYCYYDGIQDGSVHVMMTIGDQSSTACVEREAGFRNTLAFYPWMNLVAEPAARENSEIYDAVIDCVTADPSIKVIYTDGDDGVTPIVSALKELGKLYEPDDPNYIYICSVDGADFAIESIRAGGSSFCANQRFDLFCTQVLDVARDYCNGVYVSPSTNKVQLSCSMIMRSNVDHLEDLGVLWALGAK